MGEFGLWSAVTAKGSALFASAIAFVGLLRFCKFLIEFVAKRIDIGSTILGQRLRRLEIELDSYREVAMLMIGVVAKIDPDNPALLTAATRLRQHAPAASMDLDELERRLNDLPGRDQTNEPAA
jgi:hypothetical protein